MLVCRWEEATVAKLINFLNAWIKDQWRRFLSANQTESGASWVERKLTDINSGCNCGNPSFPQHWLQKCGMCCLFTCKLGSIGSNSWWQICLVAYCKSNYHVTIWAPSDTPSIRHLSVSDSAHAGQAFVIALYIHASCRSDVVSPAPCMMSVSWEANKVYHDDEHWSGWCDRRSCDTSRGSQNTWILPGGSQNTWILPGLCK